MNQRVRPCADSQFQGKMASPEDVGAEGIDLICWNGEGSLQRCDSTDNVEALNVLLKLDEVLNECLKESGDDSDCESRFNNNSGFSDDFVTKNNDGYRLSRQISLEELEGRNESLSVEECLNDLDEYLKTFDDSFGSNTSLMEFDLHGRSLSLGNNSFSTPHLPLIGNDLGRGALQKTPLSYCNLGYISNELNKTESDTRRPLSSCGSRAVGLTRNHACRATIGAIKFSGGEERAPVLHPSGCVDNPSSNDRTSAADGDEAIDWSWLNEVENAERVVVESPPAVVVVEEGMATGVEDTKRPTWLRRSMRRLQPFAIPSNSSSDPPTEDAPQTSAMDNLEPEDVHFLNVTTSGSSRPISAPSRISSGQVTRSRSTDRTSRDPTGRARSSSASSRSRRPRSLSSSVSSIPSSVDTTPSYTPTPTSNYNNNQDETNNNNPRRSCERVQRTSSNEMPEVESPLGQWPHSLSSTLAYVGCTLGIFNISRFATLSIHFGANFIFQFLIVSLFIGLPLFTLQLCLGQQLGSGVIDMWKISPMFQGVGVSLLFFNILSGVYSIIGVSWMFVYFRDSFITKFERYRWAEPVNFYRNANSHLLLNGTYKLSETVPDYLSGIVLQRHYLASGNPTGTIKFQPAFNLAVVWMIVFVSLSKGLRSYGKVIYVFTLLPIFGMFVLAAKLLGMMPPDLMNIIFPETSWNEFFVNSKSWMAACQEVFLTWGLLGAAVMQIASHNKNKHLLQRDSSLIAVITITILLLVAFLANTCVQILKANGYTYHPDSFEGINTYTFLRHAKDPLPPNLAATPVKYMVHNSFIVGDRVTRPGVDPSAESGYQVLRFATELIPATFAILGAEKISPFWTVLFYFILILFGIAQQLAIWHCVITGIMAIKAKVLKSWETTITFFSCACGFVLGLPMTTEFGIYVVYFLDLTVGGVWWLILIILLQILAVFMVRGRPYSGDTIVTAIFNSNTASCLMGWAPALLSFTWNVILPVILMVWCITFFKNGNFRELFVWHHGLVLEYWPLWARQIGSLLQLLPILAVPFIAVIQSYRYLNNGPNDILERIQLLYRPPLGEHMDDIAIQEAAAASLNNNGNSNLGTIPAEDPPPKYTPPPSYTTATGARIAKLLRQSIRRSVRRIANALGESSGSRTRPTTSSQVESQQPPPPDYNDVLVEMNQNQRDVAITVPDACPSTLQRELATIATSSTGLTAADVACILRSSFRRSTVRRPLTNDQTLSSLSAENLVDSAAPIGETSLVLNLGDNKDNNVSTVI
ncbi:PREDICTED: uncharacterized protein LOC108568137 isoform X2 [Nicrophorus vespilloides]|uniref:Uncharacterized protein LOC108568137 isoform X2 n=1 Tax=Nicrophorus vespilloides TaxID=110193 RepID=A0ABM1NCK9_NICVS|nr:PREDICTED: uncharacterized protein LOC108568137 isoform X2 [Nicrophorus vespilloides]